jgi:MFS family permease
VGAAGLVGVVPLLLIKSPRLSKSERANFAPFSYIVENRAKLSRLVLPMLITSIGAGLIMPFMNVFFRIQHNQPDDVIGVLFALSSLAMGVGMLVAPPLADKVGKIQLVVITQALSIPFLILLGFAPWFGVAVFSYYIRAGLMNMSGPVYQTFVMEQADPNARATVASLTSMSSSFGWAISPTVSGYIQVGSGFGPVFMLTIILYCISIYLYWAFFWHGDFRQALRKLTSRAPTEV